MPRIKKEAPTSPIREKRLSMPVTSEDLADLALLRLSPETLRALPGAPTPDVSEARLARAVFEAGLERVRELTDVAGYLNLAADEDYRSYHVARRGASPRYSRE